MSMSIDELKQALNSDHGIEVTSDDVPDVNSKPTNSEACTDGSVDDLFPAMTNERLGVSVTAEPGVETRQSKINKIELFESTHPARGSEAIKYPAGCGYQRGDSLAGLTDEQLDKVIAVQRCVNSSRQMSVIGASLIVQLSKLVESYISSLDGYSNNLANNLTELQEVLQEILLDNSDSIPEINSPYVKLAMILGISGISTYAANKNKETVRMKNSKEATRVKVDSGHGGVDTGEQTPTINAASIGADAGHQIEKPYCGGSLKGEPLLNPQRSGTSRAESGYGSILVDNCKPKKRPYTRKVPTKKQAEKMKALGISFEQLKQQEGLQ